MGGMTGNMINTRNGNHNFTEITNIESLYKIYKISEHVFQLGNINTETVFLNNIIEILNLGKKFIPCYYNDSFSLISFFIKNFDMHLEDFNKKIFYKIKNEEYLISKVNKEISNNDNVKKVSFNIEVQESNKFNNIFDKFRLRSSNYNIPILNETFDVKFKIYEKIFANNISFRLNISKNQLYFLKKFCKIRPFKIVDCDKNVGIIIMSNELYDKLAFDSLNNGTTYEELDYNPLEITTNEILNTLTSIYINNNISKKLLNILSPNNTVLGNYRILPKLHKSKFGIRPLVNYNNTPTFNISKFLFILLNDNVKNFDSYIQDSQHLIQLTKDLIIPENSKIFSLDFSDLYTNIDLNLASNIITEFAKDKLDSKHISLFGFNKILNLFLYNNIFKFKTKFFKQKIGIAMGSIFGPTCACIFVHHLESHWLIINRPVLYKRYIDDIILICNDNSLLNSLQNNFNNLVLNISSEEIVNFLDLNIYIDKITRKLVFSLYLKKTNTFSYLLSSSNHQKSIFKNIPKSLFIRTRRSCTNIEDYYFFSGIFLFYLLKRGYDYSLLRKIRHCISLIDRDLLINYKDKNLFDKNTVFLKLPFDMNLSINSQTKLEIQNSFKNHKLLKNLKIKIVNALQYNLSSILLFNFKIPDIKKFFTSKCGKTICKCCPFIYNRYHLNFTDTHFSLPLLFNANCETTNVVYIISCNLCNFFYIGQTQQKLKKRIFSHISTIKNFIPFYKYTDKVIAYHFNLKLHNVKQHFEVCVFQGNLIDLKDRLSCEFNLIKLFRSLNIPLLNDITELFNSNFISNKLIFK